MSPIKFKQSPNPTSQTLTGTTSSQEARLLVRETLRISANLASAPALSPPVMSPASSASPSLTPPQSASFADKTRRFGLVEDELIDSSLRFICCEEIDGRRWKCLAENDGFGHFKKNPIRSVGLQAPLTPVEEFISFVRTYVVPEGFPNSVTPSYVPYMSWRALKLFFGGAMGVFTTKTLLSSVGVSKSKLFLALLLLIGSLRMVLVVSGKCFLQGKERNLITI